MPRTPTIRHATSRDIAAITAIYNQTVGIAHANLEPVSVQSRHTWFMQHNQSNRPIFVATDANDTVLAWVSLSDYSAMPAYKPSAEISVYVDAKHTQKRLGALLVQHACTHAKNHGVINVMALIFAHNTASIRLFERLDFVQWGLLPKICWSQGDLADVVILGKKI